MLQQPLFTTGRKQAEDWSEAGVEPDLCEVFADPLVHLVMRRDGVSQAALRQVVALAQAKLGRGLCGCLAA